MIAALVLGVLLPGLYAPASAAGTLGIQALDARGQAVAMEMARQLAAAGNLYPLAIDGDPAAGDCRDKPYAAAARIATSTDRGEAGWSFDAGLVLVDCAGWQVEEWHNSLQLSHPPTDADAEKLAIDLLIRLRTWVHMHPVLSASLFTTGLAYDPKTAKPTYFYTLFKTDDGNMRAFVRPGGPHTKPECAPTTSSRSSTASTGGSTVRIKPSCAPTTASPTLSSSPAARRG